MSRDSVTSRTPGGRRIRQKCTLCVNNRLICIKSETHSNFDGGFFNRHDAVTTATFAKVNTFPVEKYKNSVVLGCPVVYNIPLSLHE